MAVSNTENNMEQIVFEIISYAGDSKSNSLLALEAAGNKDFDKADKLIQEASNEILKAHDMHTSLLQKFSSGEKIEMNVLVTHAQDHFMNAILARDLIKQMISIMKKNKGED
ncbi:PTS lactose/cellobiose transporter subunit IIA [Clostridium sp. BJN0001]|uniref:PTS lactose/cellobiose transporter subunit IIA n=1 Tax=Clostridium sp. BJN0001 TaxID=2930219 RepID=UPI001FD45AAE|nr:PTS lactose/cellobiose transporter subunit IIA [Clostridium sp. BJN0001]